MIASAVRTAPISRCRPSCNMHAAHIIARVSTPSSARVSDIQFIPPFRSIRPAEKAGTGSQVLRTTAPNLSSRLLNFAQIVCILLVLGIQAGLLVEKIQAEKVPTHMRAVRSIQEPQPAVSSGFQNLAEFQPLLLVVALAGAFLSNLFGPKEYDFSAVPALACT
jgi:hypothetical protein